MLANSLSELKKKNIKHYLGLKKGKTRRVEITANNLFFLLLSLIHCWISTSCSQNCPSAWVKKWEQVLMLSSDSGQMGKRVTEAAVELLARHIGEPCEGGNGKEQRSQSLATGPPHHEDWQPLPPATERTGDKDRDETPQTSRKGFAFQEKTGRRDVKGHDPLYQRYWKIRAEHLLITRWI